MNNPIHKSCVIAAVGIAFAMLCSSCMHGRGVPPDIAQKISSGGRVVDGRGMAALYAPLQEKEPYGDRAPASGVRVVIPSSVGLELS